MSRLYAIAFGAISLMLGLAAFIRSPVAGPVATETEALPSQPPVQSFTQSLAPASAPQPATKAATFEANSGWDRGPDRALEIPRGQSGQFHINVVIRGTPVKFMIDTGADILALTESQAQILGFSPNSSDFKPVLQSASGPAYGAEIRLEKIEIAGTELHDIQAMVVKGLSVNLLGQSVLRQMGGIELSGDKMVIRPR